MCQHAVLFLGFITTQANILFEMQTHIKFHTNFTMRARDRRKVPLTYLISIAFKKQNYTGTVDIPTTFFHPEAQYNLVITLTEEYVFNPTQYVWLNWDTCQYIDFIASMIKDSN